MITTAKVTSITPSQARTVGLATPLLALAAVVVALALPSAASAAQPRCPSGAFCMWMHAGYHGPKYVAFGSRRNLNGARYRGTNIPVAGSGSSFVNNGRPGGMSAVRLYFWGRPGNDSPSVCITRLGQAVNLALWPIPGMARRTTWNDNISGLRWVASC